MRIGHISDLHILGLEPIPLSCLFNKRITGYLNLRLRRSHVHRVEVACALLTDLAAQGVDHYVVSGDLTNLALPAEFDRAYELLRGVLGTTPERTTIVPGNHDLYTHGAARAKRFYRKFESYLCSDLPETIAPHESGGFPIVKLRGPLALIGLSTALPRPPLFASGKIGTAQLRSVRRIFAHPAVRERTPLVVLHHPARNPASYRKRIMNGLDDAARLLREMNELEHGLLLHGHLHRRGHSTIPTDRGRLEMIGAASLSLVDTDPSKMAGYNIYDFDEDGRLRSISARVYDPGTQAPVPIVIERD